MENMEEESVAALRETSRNVMRLNRRFHRDEEADNRRSVASNSITPQTVQEITNRLKTKSQTTSAELQTLKNALIEDPKNIEIVLNTHGSLRGLVKELTGNEVKKQCAAAGCFCNLGLADSKAGAAVSKAAGPYLVTALDSLTTEFAVSCAWALGNLAGSGIKASELLVAQGAVAKLCDLLLTTNEELKDAAVYALVHFAYQMKDELRIDYVTKIIEALSKSDITVATNQLLFILSCHKDFNTIGLPENYLQKLLADLPISIDFHLSSCHNICSKEYVVLCLTSHVSSVKIALKTKITFICYGRFLEKLNRKMALYAAID
ncbi:importin subunit alpha-3 [Phthorimaea operculella]|nr:importin subunit alpha-3 [Phthorimaea operculella]